MMYYLNEERETLYFFFIFLIQVQFSSFEVVQPYFKDLLQSLLIGEYTC